MKHFSSLIFLSFLIIQKANSEPIPDKIPEDLTRVKSQSSLHTIKLSEQDREILARVSYAEARGQGEAGLAGVVYTILNRFVSGRFGKTIEQVVNAPHQFEPVHRLGGWQFLPSVTREQKTKIDTIITLALTGYLPDMTKGALFFQNPNIVASRERRGKVSRGLTHFGGQTPTAVIKDHAFYQDILPQSVPSHLSMPSKQEPKKMPAYDIFSHSYTDIFAQEGVTQKFLFSH
jgi:N-acetylmuramoyl-L-alanine amidase